APGQPSDIVGEVRGDDGPVAGATVRFKGTAAAAISDESGRFRLPHPKFRTMRLTAAKEGYFIAGTSASDRPLVLRLAKLTSKDCGGYAWVDPVPDRQRAVNCGNCHREIHDEWQQSGHARSASNRRFLTLYDDVLREYPLGADVCSSCHAPTQKPGPFGE